MSKGDHDPIAAALDKILAGEVRSPDRGPTKGDLIEKYRDQLLTLRSKGWTWAAIARQLGDLGLDVSWKTIKRQLVERETNPGKKTARPTAKRGTSGASSDHTSAGRTKAAPPATKKTTAERAAGQPPKPRSTETDFVTIKGDEL